MRLHEAAQLMRASLHLKEPRVEGKTYSGTAGATVARAEAQREDGSAETQAMRQENCDGHETAGTMQLRPDS